MTVGGPGQGRLERLDDRRVRDIRALPVWVERFRNREDRLPGALGELEPMLPGSVAALDPGSGAPYGYDRLDTGGYRLCADLALLDKLWAETVPRHIGPDDKARVVADPEGRRFCVEGGPPA